MKNKRILIIDAHNQFLRSYIVDPSLSRDGRPIGGCKGFLKILNKLTREMKPDMIVVVWDGEGGSARRKAANKNYKANRKPLRLNRGIRTLSAEEEHENKIWQQLEAISCLNETPVIQFMEPAVEADDVIAYLVGHVFEPTHEKIIVSSDKDFIQLLAYENTILYRPTQKEVLNKNRIIENYKIHPTNFALARAIVGDTSDNLPGVPAVGLATVAKRLDFLSEEKTFLIKEVIDFCKKESERDSKLKVFSAIVESEKIVKENYKLMQLYSPMMSSQMKNRLKRTIQDWFPAFNKTALKSRMINNGFGEITLGDLYISFNRMKLADRE